MTGQSDDAAGRAAPLPEPGFLALVRAGRRALREVPGTTRILVQGFVLTYAVSFLLAAAISVAVYFFLVQPALEWTEAWGANQGALVAWAAVALKGVLWVGEGLAILASQVVAFLLTLAMMGLWFEAVVDKVVRFRRPPQWQVESPGSSSFMGWVRSIGASLRASAWLVFLSILALLLALVPILGPFLAFFINAYVMGRDIRDPYVSVRAALGEPVRGLVKGRLKWTVQAGVAPVLVAMVPVVGWILLPVMMTWLVTGMAWLGEELVIAEAGPSASSPTS